jgi:flagellar motor switch protein FliG
MVDFEMSLGLQKAASLIITLGVENSSKVLQYLSESEIERVLMAVSKGVTIPPDIRLEALEDAYEMATDGGVLYGSGGVEYSRQLLSRAVGPRRGAEILERISARDQLSSFEILRSADPAQVAAFLQDEMPQTIALVLSYVEAKVAAEIMTNLPGELQVDVILCLASMDRVSPQVIQVVEHNLKDKLSGMISEVDFRDTGGVNFLVKVLNQVERGNQKSILSALEESDPKLVEEIRTNMFTFDDLVKLDDRTMQRVMRDVSKADLAMALKGASERLKDLVFRNLSERARDNLKEEIEILGPQLAKNVYEAQRRMVDAVRALEESGEIVIGGGGGEYELIT